MAPVDSSGRSDPPSPSPPKAEWAGLPRDVWAVSFTSLFADMGYEMVLPILPFFLAFSLAASPFIVGFVDGAAQFGQSVMSTISGDLWAHRPGRRLTGALGYLGTGIAHALIAVTTTWPQVLVLRVSAWLGRGARQPVKSAILANASPPGREGKTFGLEQALDSAGAVAGTIVAIVVLSLYAVSEGSNPTAAFRAIFWISAIPSAIAVLIMVLVVRDRKRAAVAAAGEPKPQTALRLPAAFRWFLVAEAVFGLGYFSILLALLRVGENLLPSSGNSWLAITITSLLLYLMYNIVYTVVSFPAGHWSDRRPGVAIIGLSFGLFAGVDLLLIGGFGLVGGILAFLIAGVQVGIQGVAESAWVARNVDPTLVGKAFGRLGSVQGLTILTGSLLVGGLWTYVTPTIAFTTSAVLCIAGALLLWPAGTLARPQPGAGPPVA